MGKLTDKVAKGVFWVLLEKFGIQTAHFVVTPRGIIGKTYDSLYKTGKPQLWALGWEPKGCQMEMYSQLMEGAT